MNNSRSQNQIYMTLYSMDDSIDKHSTNALRTYAQQMMANIYVGGVEKLLLAGVFFLLLSSTEE
jgi:hypothetical protein